MRYYLILVSWVTACAGMSANLVIPPEGLKISLIQDRSLPNYGCLVVTGIDANSIQQLKQEQNNIVWENIFRVYTGAQVPTPDSNKPSIVGTYQIEDQSIVYKPRLKFSSNMDYVAVFDLHKLYSQLNGPQDVRHKQVIFPFSIFSEAKEPSTVISQVYPSANQLPMNQLKLYIHFSAPMRLGQAYDYIKLFNLTTRKYEEDAFLAVPEELWNSTHTRFTLFFDPGRIKRGIAPNLQLGLPLKEGHRYRLEIDKNWKDVNGNSLVGDFVKEFSVGPADRMSPHEKNWKLDVPSADTREPVMLMFEEMLDHGLLSRVLVIVDSNGERVRGEAATLDNEKKWFFIPQKPWILGDYKIVIDTWLEDLAGNNIRRLFDINLNDPDYHKRDETQIAITFSVHYQ